MQDSAATIKDIARAIEQLSAIRVRQLAARHCPGTVSFMTLDTQAQDVRNHIVHLAAELPLASGEFEKELTCHVSL